MPKTNDLTNKRFGKLLVLHRSEEKEDRYYTWLCRCDCGNEILVNTKRLTRGTVSDCGCERIRRLGPKAENLKGSRFGRLSVISRVINGSGDRTRWLCKCDCGKDTIVTSHELKAGKTKSCGCIKADSHTTMVDLTGFTFDAITVLRATEERDYKGSIKWVCRCNCGKEFLLSADSIRHGNYKSCGCVRERNGKELQKYLTFIDGTCVEWIEKRKKRSDNTSGYTGVYITEKQMYRAQITLSGKRYYLGTYKTIDDAVKARRFAEEELHESFVITYKEWEQKALDDPQWALKNPFHFEVDKTKLRFNR